MDEVDGWMDGWTESGSVATSLSQCFIYICFSQGTAVLIITSSYARTLYPSVFKMVRHIQNLVGHEVIVL